MHNTLMVKLPIETWHWDVMMLSRFHHERAMGSNGGNCPRILVGLHRGSYRHHGCRHRLFLPMLWNLILEMLIYFDLLSRMILNCHLAVPRREPYKHSTSGPPDGLWRPATTWRPANSQPLGGIEVGWKVGLWRMASFEPTPLSPDMTLPPDFLRH